MDILINTDNIVEANQDFKDKFRADLEHSLRRFENYVTRYEVFFSDSSSNKDTPNDHQCVIEARIKGRDPERVSSKGDNYHIAFNEAVDKIKSVLDRVVAQQRGR